MTVDPHYRPLYIDPFLPSRGQPALDAEEAAYSNLVVALREAQEAVTRCRPDAAGAARAAQLLAESASLLGPGVEEDQQLAGRVWAVAGRAQALAPPLHIDEVTTDSARGRVAFGRFHGGTGTVHGGAVPLIYDELLGRLATSAGRPFARTAYLHVDYRAGIPLDTEIEVDAAIVSIVGRKIVLRSQMILNGQLLTECEGLWVQIRPVPMDVT